MFFSNEARTSKARALITPVNDHSNLFISFCASSEIRLGLIAGLLVLMNAIKLGWRRTGNVRSVLAKSAFVAPREGDAEVNNT